MVGGMRMGGAVGGLIQSGHGLHAPQMFQDEVDNPGVGDTDKTGLGTQTHPINLNSPAMPIWQRMRDRMNYQMQLQQAQMGHNHALMGLQNYGS